MERAVRRRSVLVVALALALIACGSGGGGTTAGTSPPVGTAPSASGSCRAQAGLTGKVTGHGTDQVAGSAVRLQAGDFFFAATCVVVAGGTLSVTVKNDGQALHNFSVSSLGIDSDVAAGQSITVTVRFDGSAPLPFFCKYHVSAGMQGALVPA